MDTNLDIVRDDERAYELSCQMMTALRRAEAEEEGREPLFSLVAMERGRFDRLLNVVHKAEAARPYIDDPAAYEALRDALGALQPGDRDPIS